MHMSILKFTKRTVVLLEPEIYAAISERAQRSGLSIGELVRRAIKQSIAAESAAEQIPETQVKK
jgi:predicted HicB family RNase H-like nuclease